VADMRHLARWEIDEIVQHMNEDHADSLLLYARHYCGCADALSASLLDVSGQSCSMSVNCQSGSRTVVFELKRSVTNIKQAEMVMVEMHFDALRAETESRLEHTLDSK
jgi:putative heme iron utilization protein